MISSRMMLIPALDILNGNCVRLRKGDFEQVTQYGLSPDQVLKQFKTAGAEWAHVVDLSGARNPEERQLDLISKLVKSSGLKIQTGGGIRTQTDVIRLIEAGVHRVVIGSLAIQNPVLFQQIVQAVGAERVTLAIDVTDADSINTPEPSSAGLFPDLTAYRVATHGWTQTSKLSLIEAVQSGIELGIQHYLCTDIRVDGMLSGPNFSLYRVMKEKFPTIQIQASGGVSSAADLQSLAAIPVSSVIVGKAMYEGRIDLATEVKRYAY